MSGPDAVLLRTERLTRSFGSLMAVARWTSRSSAASCARSSARTAPARRTFFRLISGEMAPSSGRYLSTAGHHRPAAARGVSRLGIAKSYQITNIFPHLTVLENVRVAVQCYARVVQLLVARRSADRRARPRRARSCQPVELGAKADELAAHLSHGEQRHLEIGIALASEPTLLLLDEPTAGMSPEETDETMRADPRLAAGAP